MNSIAHRIALVVVSAAAPIPLLAFGCGDTGPTSQGSETGASPGSSTGGGSGSSSGGASSGGLSSGGAALSSGGAALSSGGVSSSGSGGAAPGGTGGQGASTGGEPCVPAPTDARRHPGVYDYKSCDSCHSGMLGGWVYSNAAGDAWLAGATVTVRNSDGTTVVAPTAVDGFFHLEGTITSSFTPCVSRCSDEFCAANAHSSTDCQNAACHGAKDHLIYLAQPGSAGTGGSSGGSDCTAPASGGPRMHYPDYDDQSCGQFCHDPSYVGGYLYNGVSGTEPVSMATLTLTPTNGTPMVAVTGPGGMFQIQGQLTAPYTACVSKCPDKVCSAPTTHTTTDECYVCHVPTLRIHLP